LIQFLSGREATGIVSTHELALGKLAATDNGIENYHFEEGYANQTIRYDYKLRPGISRTRNAIALMRMTGLKLDKEIL
jgi:DNA mismatch repair ATPase MutS